MATREAAALRERRQSANAREIGPGWDVENPARRKRGLADLRTFLKCYFPMSFRLEWSPDQVRVIGKIEEAARNGGLFALAMPRGSGKTTITERAALWCILGGLHRFVLIVAATEERGKQNLDKIKRELRKNPILADDFPEVCHPIRALNNEGRRAIGQTWLGINTDIGWGQTQLVFPTAPDSIESNCRGAVISVAGMTSAIRGHSELLPNGETIRPSFMLIDDPQTRESAESEGQCATREAIIAGDVLGSAGPDDLISAVMPCTVIRKGDMADRLLDRSKHPDWNGERMKMVYSFPANQQLWDEYAEIRSEALMEGRGTKEATAFYRKHRKAMDEGCEVAWRQRKRPDELSAIQNAMNLLFRDRTAFFAEYQNEPIEEQSKFERLPTADEICRKTNGIPRGELAPEWSHVTAMIDVQQDVLFWLVAGFGSGFSGGVVDYGTFPDQGRGYFTLGDLSMRLRDEYPGYSVEQAIFAGLRDLTGKLASHQFACQDGTLMRIERLLIDEGYQADVVYQFCRQQQVAGFVMPSKGFGVKAGNKPLNEYDKRPGDSVGMHCRIATAQGRPVRHLLIDTNEWKSFVMARLAAPMGGAGCLSLFGSRSGEHRLLADHLKAEACIKTFGRGREVTEWSVRPGRPDNHWFDCLVGVTCAASLLGCSIVGEGKAAFGPRKQRIPLSQMGRR